MDEILKRDQNFIVVLGGVTDDANEYIRMFRVDPATGALLISAAGLGTGTVTSISQGTGIVLTPNPITTTGTVALSVPLQPIATLAGNSLKFLRVNAGETAVEYATISAGLVVGSTAITGGATTRVLFDNAGVLGEYVISGSGNVAMTTSPVFTTPNIGVPSAGTLTNCTGLPIVGGTINTLTLARGGTGLTAISALSIWAANVANTLVEITAGAGQSIRVNGGGTAWEAFTPSAAVPTTITVANEATDTTCFVAFFTAATGDLGPKTNTNMTFNSNTGVVTFASSVLTTTDINGGTIDGTVIGGASAAAITGTAIIGNSFVPNASTIPLNGMYLPAAATLGWSIASALELQLTGTALSPGADGGSSLGTTALGWQNMFGNTGFVLNIENGDWVATHTAGILTIGTGTLKIATPTNTATSVVTIDGTQTFTNKTLTSSTNVLGGVTMTLGSDADGDMYYRASNVLTRLAKGTALQQLRMNAGATAPEWFTASAGGSSTLRTSVANFDIVAGSSRYGITNTGGGTSTGGGAGLILAAGAISGSTGLLWQICGGASDAELGSPLFSTSFAAFTVGTDFTYFIGLGAITNASAGLTMTDAHIGFKITRTSSGAINLVGTQANGTESVTATLTTFAVNDSMDLIFKVNGSSSVDYYWRKNGGTLSAATNLTTNMGTGLFSGQAAISNKTVASNTVMQISSMSYQR